MKGEISLANEDTCPTFEVHPQIEPRHGTGSDGSPLASEIYEFVFEITMVPPPKHHR
jgi:hypothetical protein